MPLMRFDFVIKRDGDTISVPRIEAATQEAAEEIVRRDHPECEILKCELKYD